MAKSDLILTPATWPGQKGNLNLTPAGLLDLVGWYGSTHAAAMWRKAADFLAVFKKERTAGFDPQTEGWDPSYAEIEAEVMAIASVIIIRLENNELLNGSLGSIAEVGLALTSAALRGQVVIVSIEEGLLTSLNDPGAIAQYMILELFLEDIEHNPALTDYLRIHRGDDLQALAQQACSAAQQQNKSGLAGLNFDDFRAKKTRRKQNYPLRVLLGGSGGPYAEAYRDTFNQKKKRLMEPYAGEGFVVKILSEGVIAHAWNIPYGSTDPLSAGLATRTLLSIELESKQEADFLILPIMAEATSKAAATEIGFLLLNALSTGQDIRIFLEPLDPVDYIRYQLMKAKPVANADEKAMRIALRQAGVPDPILATATLAEVSATYELVMGLSQGHPPPFKQVKQSLLGQTEAFQAADNVRRVRVLVQAHLERLNSDSRYSDFFSYATQI
jgi:hypothetical protein